MCGGIEYQGDKIYFPMPDPRLPVLLKDGSVTWMPWGHKNLGGKMMFPNGGWARLDSIHAGV